MQERLQLRVFISSVQKEMASERLALQIMLTTDPFLQQHIKPVLFEREPQSLRPEGQAYLRLLDKCQLFALILGKTYGSLVNDLSATHHEYRRAQELNLPTLVCVLGDNRVEREKELVDFFEEVKKDGHTYDRFASTAELQLHARARIVKHIHDFYHLEPTKEETTVGETTLRVASAFERNRLQDWTRSETVASLSRKVAEVSAGGNPSDLTDEQEIRELLNRGYFWLDDENQLKLTAAGLLLLGRDPSACFVHCRVQLDAFAGKTKDAKAVDHTTACGNVASVVDQVIAFIERNTRHPLRVVGTKRIEVAEYPLEAIREAVVNALAHRDYEDATRHVVLEVFNDRIVISSPGGPPGDSSMSLISRGTAKSRTRNPLLAQGLRFLDLMEERGTGILRMKASMLEHGLETPMLNLDDGYFVVTLPGAGDDLERVRVPHGANNNSVLSQLTERQRQIAEQAIKDGAVSTSWCTENLGITRDTAVRELGHMCNLGILKKDGVGRGTKYVPGGAVQ